MRDYGVVSPRFWIGSTGKALRGNAPAQVLALYLMTSPHANMIGVFHCPLIYMAHETGLSMEGALKALQSLIEAKFCTYEESSETVFVHRMAAFQIGDQLSEQDKRCKGVEREWNNIPSAQLRQAFFAIYSGAFHLPKQAKKTRGTEAPSKPLRSQEQEQDQEQDQETPPAPRGDGFEVFWSAYPRKVGKDAARKAYERRSPNAALRSEMLAAITSQSASEQWRKNGGQYIPHPATWLNEGRWQDAVSGGATAAGSGPKRGSDEYAALHKDAAWWREAGFPSVYDAIANRCWHNNADQFRDGKRIEVAA